MKVIIIEAFTGFPDDPKGSGRDFVPGPDAIEVPDEFGAMIVKKGHAKAADDKKPAKPGAAGVA